jgi:hypothetical protein
MSNNEIAKAECPFSGQGEALVNVRFFRGTRDDVIASAEILEEVRSAQMQVKLQTAEVSKLAPASRHPTIDVRHIVANL